MSLEVIGAGWGRTGTESLKAALERLGFGRCYHMFELLARTRHAKHWRALARGDKPDYAALFEGFRAAVDFPAARYYRELAAQFPQAKVVLSVRDPESWYESASKTILRGIPLPVRALTHAIGRFSPNLRQMPELFEMIDHDLFAGFFEGRVHDRAYMISRFNAWNDEVKATIPKERLLVYDIKQGWEPLCAFLQVPVPAEAFPRNNDGAAFDRRVSATNAIREFWRGA